MCNLIVRCHACVHSQNCNWLRLTHCCDRGLFLKLDWYCRSNVTCLYPYPDPSSRINDNNMATQGDVYLYDEEIYLDRIPDNFSCPICLCPIQRIAHLAECCGNHFCFQCISRVTDHHGPCPMCKCEQLKVFPNKERQREVNQLRVRCPFPQCNPTWEGVLGLLDSHLRENHQEAKDSYLFRISTYVDQPLPKLACPICRCLVQRVAHLSVCCGSHFCLQCVNKVLYDRQPCPSCKGELKAVPNKERQREINQLKVRCPFLGECPLAWEGELSKVEQHIQEKHKPQDQSSTTVVTAGVAALSVDPKNQETVGGVKNGTAVGLHQNGTAIGPPGGRASVSSQGNGNVASQSEAVAVVPMPTPVLRPSTAPVDFSQGGSWNGNCTTPTFLEGGQYSYPYQKPWCGPRGHHHRHHGHHGHHPGMPPPPPPPHSGFPAPPPPGFPPSPSHPDFPPPPHPPFGPPSPHLDHHGHHGHHGHHRGHKGHHHHPHHDARWQS